MPFIGTQPDVGGYSVLDALTASATASYTLQKDSANFSPSSANQLLVSLNGVIQKPGSSFTVSGSTLTFSSALDPSDSIDFILAMGEPLLVGTPSDGTVSTAKIASGAVTGAKIENNPTIAGNLTVSGNTAASGTLTSTGLITASAGVAIGGTGAANTLDDYEEGTFTPSAEGFTTAGTFNALDTSQASYHKIGRMVHVYFVMNFTLSGESGTLKITGMPFTCSQEGVGTFQCNNMEANYASNVAHYTPIIQSGNNYVMFRGTRTDGGNHHTMAAQNLTYVRVSIVYETAS